MPSGYNDIRLSGSTTIEAVGPALSIRSLTDTGEAPVARGPDTAPRAAFNGPRPSVNIEAAGFVRQPAQSAWLYRLEASLEAGDGQVLGYPWIGTITTTNEMPALGLAGAVWESGNGPVVPVFARNVLSITARLQAIDAASLLSWLRPPTVPARGQPTSTAMPLGQPLSRKLSITPNAVEAHGLDLRSLLSPGGTGLVVARVDENEVVTPNPRRNQQPLWRSGTIQVTNLGVSVKDSPRSTLVFVTRLDNAVPVAGARVNIVSSTNQTLWTGTTGTDGVAMAPALPLRPQRTPSPPFIVTVEKDGDLAFVASDWMSDPQPWRLGFQRQWSLARQLRGSVFTDRGVYRQGDVVRVKAVLRADDASGAALLAPDTPLTLLVHDSRGSEVDRRSSRRRPVGCGRLGVAGARHGFAGLLLALVAATRIEHGADRRRNGIVPRGRLPDA